MWGQILVPVLAAALCHIQELSDGLRLPRIHAGHVLHVFYCHIDDTGEAIQNPEPHNGHCAERERDFANHALALPLLLGRPEESAAVDRVGRRDLWTLLFYPGDAAFHLWRRRGGAAADTGVYSDGAGAGTFACK